MTYLKNSKWMSELDSTLPLNRVSIPGSHNAGTYGINCRSPWNPYVKDDVGRWAAIAMKIAPCIVVDYSKVQNLDLVDQFRHGIRCFDLRVVKYSIDNTMPPSYRFVHGLVGSNLIDDVKALLEFSKQFKTEIIILDVRFRYGFDPSDHIRFQQELLNIIGDRLVDRSFTAKTTLQEFYNAGKNIIVIYNDDPNANAKFWQSSSNIEVYASSDDPSYTVDYITKAMNDSYDSTISQGQIFSVWGILTPDDGYVAWHLLNNTQYLAAELNAKMVNLVQKEWQGKCGCLMYDVAEYPGLADAIIKGNYA